MRVHHAKYSVAVALLILSSLASNVAFGQDQTAHGNGSSPSPDSQPIVVELFTSEGCSSCPPADAFLQRLDKLQPVAGAQLIVLSEHVTYWDHEGWKDPYSSEALTQRQQDYERALQLATPYTPQVIVDGISEIKLSDPKQIEAVFQRDMTAPKVPVHIRSVTEDPANPELLRAHVEVGPTTSRRKIELYLAVALDHVDSQILHGENGGRHLSHVAVVSEIERVAKLSQGGSFADDVSILLKNGVKANNCRVVAFVQESGQGKLVGAALWKAAP
jgi:hypothetical protein